MDHIRDWLFWLDASPARYWTVAWLSFALVCSLSLAPTKTKSGRFRLSSSFWFVLSLMLTLFAFRWPSVFFLDDLNPDEAQIIAGALTLDHFPFIWKYLDTTTHGPLCEYGLVFAHRLGATFSYPTARILAILMQGCALIALWGTLRRFTTETTARLGILPGLAFWSFVSWDDFLHYSSELPGILLLSLATWGMAVLLTSLPARRSSSLIAFAVGLALAGVPFGKLQSAPHAVAVLLLGMGFIWFTPDIRAQRIRLLVWLMAGAASVGAVLTAYLQIFHLWRQFWLTYVASAVAFLDTSGFPFSAMPGRFFNFSATSPAFAFFFWGGLAFATLYLREPVVERNLRIARRVAWLLLGVALFTVLRPGRESAHYLHLLVVPLTTVIGLTLAGASRFSSYRHLRSSVLASFAFLTLGTQVFNSTIDYNRFVGHAKEHWQVQKSPAAQFILQRAVPGDTMAMWGWEPDLLVEVQMPHATREAQSANQIMQWPLTEFFVNRYIHDVQNRSPTWFVDAVGPGAFIFDSRATQAHESIPALEQFVDQNYELLAEIGSTRIYHLKPGSSID